MLRDWEKKHPGRIESIFDALGNVVPSHLMDRALFDFARRARDRAAPRPTATSRSTSTRCSSARPMRRGGQRVGIDAIALPRASDG